MAEYFTMIPYLILGLNIGISVELSRTLNIFAMKMNYKRE